MRGEGAVMEDRYVLSGQLDKAWSDPDRECRYEQPGELLQLNMSDVYPAFYKEANASVDHQVPISAHV